MILNKLEIMIVFSFISPLLFPLTVMSLKSNVWVYNLITSKTGARLFGKRWTLNPPNQVLNVQIHLLWFGVVVLQFWIVALSFLIFDSSLAPFSYITIFVCIANNVVFGVRFVLHRRSKKLLQQIGACNK